MRTADQIIEAYQSILREAQAFIRDESNPIEDRRVLAIYNIARGVYGTRRKYTHPNPELDPHLQDVLSFLSSHYHGGYYDSWSSSIYDLDDITDTFTECQEPGECPWLDELYDRSDGHNAAVQYVSSLLLSVGVTHVERT